MTEPTSLQTSYVDPSISAAMVIYDRLTPLQNALGLGNLDAGEMQLFAMVAHHTGLDPFTKQIYAIKRGGKVMHQTGIDGYRSTAERTTQYRGSDAPEFEPCECGDKDSPEVHPKIARVTVYRAFPEGIRGQVGEARWHELKPKHTKGNFGYTDDMWWQMPENQLAKCAEANGLRKAFPRVLGGVYIAEEMEQAGEQENEALVAAAKQPTASERVKARRQAIESPKDPTPFPGVEILDHNPIGTVAGEPVVSPLREPAPIVAGLPATDPGTGEPVNPPEAPTEPLPLVAAEPPQDPPGEPVAPAAVEPVAPAPSGDPGGCQWRLALKAGEIVDCTFEPLHKGDHSWTEQAISKGGRVLPPTP